LRKTGLSLIEVLAAMLILTVGATSLLALFASASSTHKRAVDRTHAALVAEQIVSTVQSRYTAGIDLRDLTSTLQDSLPSKIDGYFWEVAVHRPFGDTPEESAATQENEPVQKWTEDELVVRIAVKWSVADHAREEVYSTIILPRTVSSGR
jgi:Tfp pilus assembly protein PilV